MADLEESIYELPKALVKTDMSKLEECSTAWLKRLCYNCRLCYHGTKEVLVDRLRSYARHPRRLKYVSSTLKGTRKAPSDKVPSAVLLNRLICDECDDFTTFKRIRSTARKASQVERSAIEQLKKMKKATAESTPTSSSASIDDDLEDFEELDADIKFDEHEASTRAERAKSMSALLAESSRKVQRQSKDDKASTEVPEKKQRLTTTSKAKTNGAVTKKPEVKKEPYKTKSASVKSTASILDTLIPEDTSKTYQSNAVFGRDVVSAAINSSPLPPAPDRGILKKTPSEDTLKRKAVRFVDDTVSPPEEHERHASPPPAQQDVHVKELLGQTSSPPASIEVVMGDERGSPTKASMLSSTKVLQDDEMVAQIPLPGESVDNNQPSGSAATEADAHGDDEAVSPREAAAEEKAKQTIENEDNESERSEDEVFGGESDFSDISDDSGDENDDDIDAVLERANLAMSQLLEKQAKSSESSKPKEVNKAPTVDLDKAKDLLVELSGGEPIIQQVEPSEEVLEEMMEKQQREPPPLPVVPADVLERRKKRRAKLELLKAHGALPSRKNLDDYDDDDDIFDDDEECYVDIDLDYEKEIARLIREALEKNNEEDELIDLAPDHQEEYVAVDEEAMLAADVADLLEDIIVVIEEQRPYVPPPAKSCTLEETPNIKSALATGTTQETEEEQSRTRSAEEEDEENMPLIPPSLFDVRTTADSNPSEELVIMPHLPDEEVQLDFYNGDLHMKSLQFNRHAAEPDTADGFVTMWCGIRATYGVTFGRVAYQCRVSTMLSSATVAMNVTDDMPDRWGFRCGWSLGSVQHAYGYVLGDQENTWAYSINAGHKGTASRFVEWGRPALPGDIITCLLDLHRRCMEFLVNGESCGIAFVDLPVAPLVKPESEDDDEEPQLDAYVYYPHVCAKNVRFEVNFGQQNWGEPLPPQYKFINNYNVDDRVRASKPPETKTDCTVLMMCGMPGAGKTRWVHEYLSEHTDEQWTVLSTDAALEHMKLLGRGRHADESMRWDHIMGLAWKATFRWHILASRRKRNYIIDGTNVSLHARRRRMLPFQHYSKKCVFLMPSEEIETRRRQKLEQLTGVSIPNDAILEMKGLFCVPERATDPYFEKIYYAELPERGDVNSALRLAKKYNREGKVWYQSRHGYKYGAFTDGKHYRDKVLKEQQEHVAMARVPDETDYDAEGAEIIIADDAPQGRIVTTTDLGVNLAAGMDASRTQDENNATHASWRQDRTDEEVHIVHVEENTHLWPKRATNFFGIKEEPTDEQQPLYSTRTSESDLTPPDENAERTESSTSSPKEGEYVPMRRAKLEGAEATENLRLLSTSSQQHPIDVDDDEEVDTRVLWRRTKERRQSRRSLP